MGLGGIIAGALNGGAQAVESVANNALVNRDKMALASHESQLAQERAAAVARLQQAIGREDALYNTSGAGGQARTQYEVARAKQLGEAETGTLVDRMTKTTPLEAERAGAIDDAKGYHLAPGSQVVRGGKVIAENSNPTMTDVYREWGNKKGEGAAGAGGAARPDHFDEKQIDAAREKLGARIDKAFVDEATGKPLPAASAVGLRAFNGAVAAGRAPGEAQEAAYQATHVITQEAQQLLRDPKYKGQVRDMNAAIDLAIKLRQQKMAADQGSK